MAGLSTPFPFTFCIREASDVDVVAGEGNYRIVLTWEELFEWEKRVKFWKITGTGGLAEIGSASGPDVIASVSGVTTADGGAAFASESEYACEEPVLTAQSINYDYQENDEGGYAEATIQVDFSIFDPNLYLGTINRAIVFDTATGLYYPYINLTWSAFCENDAPAGKEISSNIADTSGDGSMTVTFFGKPLTFYWLVVTDTDGVADPISTIDVSPGEWWPYNPLDGGGPVWSDLDGSMLRDPFSVQEWN